GGTVLENGVAKTSLAGAKNNQTFYTIDVPAGATDLKFVTTGGTGDADLYVKFNGNPTTGAYDCRSWASGNTETCNISSVQTGKYHVLINAYSAYSGMSLTASYTPAGGGGDVKFFENTTDVAIEDKQTVQSVLAVSNSGSGGTISVKVDIKHTYIGDLRIDVIAPSGKSYRVKDTSNDSSDDLLKTYSINASGESYDGNWTLRVYDAYNADTGKIDSWSITLP
ncbi:MAG: proprotein convertase P-domain-containing protein, partial [Psychrosphaera sp.]|nr:proprotein convertase P-domain-containing protein [Psychrosphaera sp.]